MRRSVASAVCPSAAGSVNETSVRPVPPVDTFCTIMSMLISASASAWKIAAAWPGLSGTSTTVTFTSERSCATPAMIACSTVRSSIDPVTRVPFLVEYDERTCSGRSWLRAYSTLRR